jgi:hypothetical protein
MSGQAIQLDCLGGPLNDSHDSRALNLHGPSFLYFVTCAFCFDHSAVNGGMGGITVTDFC